jgi:hypothetical protein
MAYRLSRNLEASLIDYFRAEALTDNWKDLAIEKNLKQAIIAIPSICISIIDTDNPPLEIGSGVFLKFPRINIRIFAKDDGMRLDLADWVIEKLEGDIDYYTYTISGGIVTGKTIAGSVGGINITRNEKELANTNPENLEKEDRYRHLISFTCNVGLI